MKPIDYVREYLQQTAERWKAAVTASPPDFTATEDMPALPGRMSIQNLLDAMAGAHVYEHPRPSVTVDVVVFGIDDGPDLKVLLIKRGRPGTVFEGHWAIPGGFVDPNEDLDVAARRELKEETHAEPAYIEQLATFGKPGRDPRGHVVSVAYMALVRCDQTPIQGDDDAAEAAWWSVKDLAKIPLAFDHGEILGVAIKRLRTKARYQPIGIDLLPETFSLTELQRLYEVILDKPLDKRNFRKRVLKYGVLEAATSQRIIGGPGPAPQTFRFDRNAYESLLEEGEDFEV